MNYDWDEKADEIGDRIRENVFPYDIFEIIGVLVREGKLAESDIDTVISHFKGE